MVRAQKETHLILLCLRPDTIQQLRDFYISKKGTIVHFPFDEVTLVFKVMEKIDALVRLDTWEKWEQQINLKYNPENAIELRGVYEGVQPG